MVISFDFLFWLGIGKELGPYIISDFDKVFIPIWTTLLDTEPLYDEAEQKLINMYGNGKPLEERIKHLEELNHNKDNTYLKKIDTYNMI